MKCILYGLSNFLGSDHLEGNQFSDAKKSSDINTSDAKKDNHNLNSNSQTLSHEHSKPLYSKKTSSKTETQALKRTPNPTSTQQLSKPQLEVVSAATGDTLEPIRNSAQKAQEKSKPKFKENVEPEEVFVELHPLPRDKSCEQIAQTEFPRFSGDFSSDNVNRDNVSAELSDTYRMWDGQPSE